MRKLGKKLVITTILLLGLLSGLLFATGIASAQNVCVGTQGNVEDSINVGIGAVNVASSCVGTITVP